MNRNGTFHILALDGGGARGIYPAQLLASIEQTLGVPVKESFDLIAGTSTGSIIAGAAAVGIPMTQVVDLFNSETARIFRKRRLGSFHVRSKYALHPLDRWSGKRLVHD